METLEAHPYPKYTSQVCLPIFYLCSASLQQSALDLKESREIFCGGGNLDRKFHLISWSEVCLSKKKGGLGIRNLNTLNKLRLGKWN